VQNVADGHAHWIVRGLQRNHSIVLVSFMNENGSSDFNDAERRLIQAYCDRNQFLAALWPMKDPNDQNNTSNEGSSTSSTSTACTTSTAVMVAAETLRTNQHPIQVQAPLLMHPGLLKVAQDIPQARSAMLMRGLFKLKHPQSPTSH
jgi:hypothetical protein